MAVPATRLHELGRWLVGRGHRVGALVPWPHHPTGVVPERYRGRPLVRETVDGIRVLRTWVLARPNEGFARLLDQLSFAVMALLTAPLTGRADAVIAISPPIFLAAAGALVAWMKRAPLLIYIGDLWVESAVEMGALRSPALRWLAEQLVRLTYRRAAGLLVVTQGIADRLVSSGVPRGRVHVLTNAVDTEAFRPAPEQRSTLRAELGLGDELVVLYAGTHGLAHGLDVVLDAADRLRERRDVRFVLVGEGADRPRLARRAAEMGLANVSFRPPEPRAHMPALLTAADACVVPLRDLPIFRGALPTKMFEAMAAARPVLLAVAGEAAEALKASGGGIVVPPEDAAALAAAVERLADDRAGAELMGTAGRAWVVEHFDRRRVAERLEKVLYRVIEG